MSLSLQTIEKPSGLDPASNAASKGLLLDGMDIETDAIKQFQHALWTAFAESFTLIDVDNGEIIYADYDGLCCELSERLGLLAEVARRGRPEIVEDVSPLVLLAIPLPLTEKSPKIVAVGLFSQLQVEQEQQVAAAAKALGVDAGRALRWMLGREIWSPRVLQHLAGLILEKFSQQHELTRLRNEIHEAVGHARDAYIELELLHRLTRNLHISNSESELWQNALTWLSDSVQAECLAIVANQTVEDFELADLFTDDIDGIWTCGTLPLETSYLREQIDRIGIDALSQPLVLNQVETSLPTWHCPAIRELVCVPIKDGEQPLAWLMAINHDGKVYSSSQEFGSVELRLLSSVGTILGIHSRNLGLYQKQSELFSGLVRSMTSAIDAKDRYTSGHSERVAKASVALAKHMGLDEETINTIYLGGLLHDIGKIGIDDTILNKPGKLTTEEYAQIKKHPQYGYEILSNIKQLNKVSPIILHHHESWDGSGYPRGLIGVETPLAARIVSVADAYDAMSSNRPYREGLAGEKIDAILLNGAGTQWDADVVDAFFAIRDEIRQIVSTSPASEPSPSEVLAVN